MSSLYQRIGGEPAVRATVFKMYDKILSDNDLAPLFEGIDVDRLRLSQLAFVTYAFGGPSHYTGQGLRAAHKSSVERGLSDHHFDRVAFHLAQAMRELSVEESLITEALTIVGNTRADVLGK